MSSYIDLNYMYNDQGITIKGPSSSNNGIAINDAGDVNGDRYSDIILGSPYANGRVGAVYVVFGSSSIKNTSNIDLNNLYPPNGFVISNDITDNFRFGTAVDGNCYINDDEYADIIIGETEINSFTGAVYIVYGKHNVENSNLSDLLSANQAIVILGKNNGDNVGTQGKVGCAGDINNDKYDDIILNDGDKFYIIYGAAKLPAEIQLSAFNINNGITIKSANSLDFISASVSRLGDVNKDGFDDIVIGAPTINVGAFTNAGQSYVVYGSSNLTDIDLSPSKFNNSMGFTIYGTSVSGGYSGQSVSGGDINGDGYSEIIIGASQVSPTPREIATGAVYIIFGCGIVDQNDKCIFTDVYLSSTSSNRGFTIIWGTSYAQIGGSVDTVGDRSIIISSGNNNKENSAIAYLISNIENNKVINIGEASEEDNIFNIYDSKQHSGYVYCVSGAGDVNGDNNTDIIIGKYWENAWSGNSYLLYGASSSALITYPSSTPTSYPTSFPTFKTPKVIPWYNTLEFRLATSFGISTISFITAWIFREKIALYVIDYWGFEYKLLFSDNKEPLSPGEIGFILAKNQETNSDELLCKVNSLYVKVDIDNGNNKGISRGLYQHIVNRLKHPFQPGQFIFLPSEKNQIRDFLLSYKDVIKYSDLGWIRGGVYKFCLHHYRQAHQAKYQFERRTDNLDGVFNSLDGYIVLPTEDIDQPLIRSNSHEGIYLGQRNIKSINFLNNEQTNSKYSCIVCFNHNVHYANPILNHPQSNEILNYAKEVGGVKAVNILLDLKMSQILTEDLSKIGLDDIKVLIKDLFANNKVGNGVPKLSKEATFPSDNKDINCLELIINLRQLVELYPIMKYISSNIFYPLFKNYLPESLQNITLPEISNTMLVTAHMSIGHLFAWQQPQASVSFYIVESVAKSGSFAARLGVSKFINDYKDALEHNEQTITKTEAIKHCVSTVLTYTVPDLLICAAAKAAMPGYECSDMNLGAKVSFAGSECYAVYKASQEPIEPTTVGIVVPYIADAAAGITSYANGYGLMGLVISVVAADWMSKAVMDEVPNEVKVYANLALDYAVEFVTAKVMGSYSFVFENESEN